MFTLAGSALYLCVFIGTWLDSPINIIKFWGIFLKKKNLFLLKLYIAWKIRIVVYLAHYQINYMDSLLVNLGFKEWTVLNGISFLTLQIKILKNNDYHSKTKENKEK